MTSLPGAAVDVIEHAAEGIGESACQFYGKVGSDCAHAFRVAAAAEHVSYDMCFSALTPSGRSTAAGEFELLGGGGHLLGVLEFSDGWLVLAGSSDSARRKGCCD